MSSLPKPIFPIYFCTLDIEIPDRAFIYNALVQQHLKTDYHSPKANNFKITDTPDRFFDRLYQRFFDTAESILGPLGVHPRSKRDCWAYMTNRHHYLNGIHNHLKTSTINAVYYFHMPQTPSYRDGSISFYNAQEKEALCYKPKNNDLIIFPNYLFHEPNACPTEEYRIAINMEIICNNVWNR